MAAAEERAEADRAAAQAARLKMISLGASLQAAREEIEVHGRLRGTLEARLAEAMAAVAGAGSRERGVVAPRDSPATIAAVRGGRAGDSGSPSRDAAALAAAQLRIEQQASAIAVLESALERSRGQVSELRSSVAALVGGSDAGGEDVAGP